MRLVSLAAASAFFALSAPALAVAPVNDPGVESLKGNGLNSLFTPLGQLNPEVANLPAPVSGAVPEPATWAMLIAGFGLVGFAARRRRTARA